MEPSGFEIAHGIRARVAGEVIVGVRPEGFAIANGDGAEANVAFVESLGPRITRPLRLAHTAVGRDCNWDIN